MIPANATGAQAAVGCEHDGDAEGDGQQQQADVDDVLDRVGHRPLRDPLHLLQLPGRHEAAGEGEEAEQHLGDDRDGPERGELRRAFALPQVVLGGADEAGRQAAEGVRERGPLRHRRERHPGERHADGEAGDDRHDDPEVVHDLRLGPGGDDGERHPGHAGVDRPPRGGRRVHPVQREDEQRRRDQVGELDQMPRSWLGPLTGLGLGLEHLQHAIGDEEAAHDVGHRGEHGDGAERRGCRPGSPGRPPGWRRRRRSPRSRWSATSAAYAAAGTPGG